MFKTLNGLSPDFMRDVFGLNSLRNDESVSSNTRFKSTFYNSCNPKNVYTGLETLRNLGPKIWEMVPENWKKETLSSFKTKIKFWVPTDCPCRLCKVFIPKLGFI